MFNLFKKDPIKSLEKKYLATMEAARDIQRSGDLRAYASKIEEAENIRNKIDELQLAKEKK
jgi:hypothetical protein